MGPFNKRGQYISFNNPVLLIDEKVLKLNVQRLLIKEHCTYFQNVGSFEL